MKMVPTSANCSSARIVFVRSANTKARLKPVLSAGLEKTMAAPVAVIIGYNIQSTEYMPRPFPYRVSTMPRGMPSSSRAAGSVRNLDSLQLLAGRPRLELEEACRVL